MIDSYGFGRIIINGKQYTNDVIVFPNRVEDSWWRKEGHRLQVEDIAGILREKPEILVVGTGYAGLMRVLPETKERLDSKGIRLTVENTRKACEIYNTLCKSKKVYRRSSLNLLKERIKPYQPSEKF